MVGGWVKSYLRNRIARLVPSMRRLTDLSLLSSLSSLLSSLVLSCPYSFIFSCLVFSVSLSLSLFLCLLSLSLCLCLRVMLCVVLCRVCRCGRGVVGSRGVCLCVAARCKNVGKPMCGFKKRLRVSIQKRPSVYIQDVHTGTF